MHLFILRYYFISIHVNIAFEILASIINYQANVNFKNPAFFRNQLPALLKSPMSNIHTTYSVLKFQVSGHLSEHMSGHLSGQVSGHMSIATLKDNNRNKCHDTC